MNSAVSKDFVFGFVCYSFKNLLVCLTISLKVLIISKTSLSRAQLLTLYAVKALSGSAVIDTGH